MIEFTNLTGKKIDYRIFRKLYKKIFIKKTEYELSVVFAGTEFMRKINFKYREKNKPPNVLAFRLDKSHGEVFLNTAEKELPYLFVHGCLHLLGYNHRNKKDYLKMRKKEKEYAL